MRVLLTLDFPPERGGIQRYLHGIVAHAFSRGDIVLVGCAHGRGRATDGAGVEIERLTTPLSRFGKKWSLIPMAIRLVSLRTKAAGRLDIECGNAYAALVPWALGRFVRMNYSVYVYGTEAMHLDKRGITGRLLRSALAGASSFTAISEFSASLIAGLGIAGPVSVLPPKISLAVKDGAAGKIPRRSGDVVRILSVGRLVPHKGHRVLLDAAALLPPALPWRLVVAGDGPERAALEGLVSRKGLAGRVKFASRLSDEELDAEYGRASMFVLPSTSRGGAEGFGIVLLEAMAARVPIIASATGGVPEVLDNGTCGILVPEGDVPALAGAIVRLAGDAELGRTLAERAWERLVARYVW
jgi:phosphatidyl-myo-inositol dimannoside synthase